MQPCTLIFPYHVYLHNACTKFVCHAYPYPAMCTLLQRLILPHTAYIPSNLSKHKPGVAHPKRWNTRQLISSATCIWLAQMQQCCDDACVQAYGTCANSVKWLCMHSTYRGQINRQGHLRSVLPQHLQYMAVQLNCICSGSANAAPPLRDDSTIRSQC